jgi:hypothetical protein
VSRWKKVTLGLGLALGASLGALLVAGVVAHEPRPSGSEGEEAGALAQRMERAADVQAWARTGAVRWTFAGRNEHLWDRRRELARVRWGETEALLRAGAPQGRAYRGGEEVHGDEAHAILRDAHARWINDSFWLNPIAKLRDPGVSLSRVELSEGEGLLVSYSSGGLTPGDAYLWLSGEDGLPRAWRMWVSILPIGGVEASWEGWTTLSTGAKIATRHQGPFGLTLELTGVEGAETLEELVPGPDPFAPLFSSGGL